MTDHFPSALGADDFIARVEVALHSYGFTGHNSISCINLCRDEATAPLKTKIETVGLQAARSPGRIIFTMLQLRKAASGRPCVCNAISTKRLWSCCSLYCGLQLPMAVPLHCFAITFSHRRGHCRFLFQ